MKNLFYTIILCFAILNSNAQNLNDSLLIHYTFDGNAVDQSGNGHNGVVNATPTQDQFGNPNSAYIFNGTSEYIDLPNETDLKPALPISYSAWVNFSSFPSTGNVMFTNNFAQNNHSGVWMQVASDGTLAIAYGSGLGGSGGNNIRLKKGTTVLLADVWYHVAGVVRGPNDMDLYIDCVNDGGSYSGNSTQPLAYTSDAGSIGRKDNDLVDPYYFHGILDDFRYWNRSITQTDINMICDRSASAKEVHSAPAFEFYPNPSSDKIHVTTEDEKGYSAKIFNMNGQEILTTSKLSTIDVSSIESGLYYIQLIDKNNEVVSSKKLIIE